MSEFWLIVAYATGLLQGLVFGYLKWGPNDSFKRSFVNGLSFKVIWGRFSK